MPSITTGAIVVRGIYFKIGTNRSRARKWYRQFIEKALTIGKRPELTGGGLVRSMGGWAAVKENTGRWRLQEACFAIGQSANLE